MNIEQELLKIISGERNSLAQNIVYGALKGTSKLYARIMTKRNERFDKAQNDESVVFRASVPVISVGNITAGGTGKTPFVTYISRYFLAKGLKPAILLRGYKAKDNSKSQIVSDGKTIYLKPEESGDEAYLLAKSLPNVAILIGRNRSESAQKATSELNVDVLIVDDGFQHRKLGRDIDLVLVDSTNPFGYNNVIPAGLLREPLTGFKRASFVVLTKTNQVDDEKLNNIKAEIKKYAEDVIIASSIHKPFDLQYIENWENGDLTGVENVKKVLALSAIGNPQSFKNTLEEANLEVVDMISYRDHHAYSIADLEKAQALAQELAVDAIAITEKDAVKIEKNIRPNDMNIPIVVLPITIEMKEKVEEFNKMLDSCVVKKEG